MVDTIALTAKPFMLVGRNTDVCDLLMEHPSISRQHAVIQHRDEGQVYIFELGSTHGTYVNKRQVRPSQHQQLQVGDVIRFGQSTRLHILQGPDELRKEVLRDTMSPHEVQKMKYDMIQATKAEKKQKQETAAAARESAGGCMWGDLEDAEEDEEEDPSAAGGEESKLSSFGQYQKNQSSWEIGQEAAAAEKQKEGMSARELDLLEKIEKRTAKMANMQLEKERILAKEQDGDLSEGQRSQVERNNKQTGKLNDEIEELREQLDELRRTQARQRGEAAPSATSERGRREQRSQQRADSDEDDFYDRIVKPKKKRSGGSGGGAKKPTLKELQVQRAELDAQKLVLEQQLAKEPPPDAVEGGAQAVTVDPLDQFMADNVVSMKVQRRQELEEQLKGISAESERIDGLLAFAQPAYLRIPVSAPAKAAGDDMFRGKLAANFDDDGQKLPPPRAVVSDPIASSRSAGPAKAPKPGSMAAALADAIQSGAFDEAGQTPQGDAAEAAAPARHELQPTKRASSDGGQRAGAGRVAKAESSLPATVNPDLFNGAQNVEAAGGARPDERGGLGAAANGTAPGGGRQAAGAASTDADTGAAKRKGASIDGKRGGLQLMSKRQKQSDEPRYGHGRRKLLDDEDALDNIQDHRTTGGFAPTSVQEENAMIVQEAAAMDSWAPPSQDSQQKLGDLAKQLGY